MSTTNKKRMVMVIDQRRCIGCHTCTIACKIENNVPKNLRINKVVTEGGDVMDSPSGAALGTTTSLADFNNTPQKMSYHTRACQHCDTHPCTVACPTNATYARTDGIVAMDYSKCIGCNSCVTACPYKDVRVIYGSDVVWDTEFALGSPNSLPQKKNVVGKCTLCSHLLDKGEKTACELVCPGRARTIGDINNQGSEVYYKIYASGREHTQLETGHNTGPAVYILKP